MPDLLSTAMPGSRYFLFRYRWLVMAFLAGSCTFRDTIVQPVPRTREPCPCAPYIRGGFTNRVSYFPGDDVVVLLQSRDSVSLCRLDIYDVKGMVTSSVQSSLFPQPSVDTTAEGFNYKPTGRFTISPTQPSGIYLIENKIPFIVKTRQPVDMT